MTTEPFDQALETTAPSDSHPAMLDFVSRDPDAKVLVVTNMWPDDERRVYGIFVKRQVDSMRSRGIGCDVLYLRGFSSPFAYPYAALQFLWRSISWRGRYRLVHVHAGETALAARFLVGPRMLVSYCGDDILGDPGEDGSIPFLSRLRGRLIGAHANLVRATITKSEQMHRQLPRRLRRRNTVLPNGVDMDLFVPVARNVARRALGWDDNELVALFAATKPNIPRKRQSLAASACAHASSVLGPVRLHIAGRIPPDEMPLLMSAADCLLHTASVEGSPNVVKEALMCNLPVVATASGDVADLLAGVEPSFLCDADVESLGTALVRCLSLRTRSNGRAINGERLSATAVAARLERLYEDLSPGLINTVSASAD